MPVVIHLPEDTGQEVTPFGIVQNGSVPQLLCDKRGLEYVIA